MVTHIENVPIQSHYRKKILKSVRLVCKAPGKLIFRPISSSQEKLLSNLKQGRRHQSGWSGFNWTTFSSNRFSSRPR